MFERSTLPRGPRVISVRVPGARSFSAVVYVRAGSRAERKDEWGTAHFLEHLVFKGTRSYPDTRSVSEAIEGVGGTSNAATDREATTYWARVPGRQARRAMTVLGGLVTQPLLRDADIENERAVIVEEIRSYRDDPGEHVFTLLDQAVFGDTPLGWEIAGSEESVKSLTPEGIRGFWERYYQPSNLVVAAAGDLPHDEVVAMVASTFGSGDGARAKLDGAPALPARERIRVERRKGAQAHLCLGVPGLRRDDPDIWALEILHTVLGDGMSSRLFLHLREEAGLAYDVHSFVTDFHDCGLLGIYAGVDPASLDRALTAILAELADLRDRPVPADELARARAFASGRLELRLEDGRNLASWLGVQEALHERTLTLEEALSRIEAVKPDDVQGLAGRLFRDEALALAMICPPRVGRRLGDRLRLP
jgi:predicted Zn-dependent peptidase